MNLLTNVKYMLARADGGNKEAMEKMEAIREQVVELATTSGRMGGDHTSVSYYLPSFDTKVFVLFVKGPALHLNVISSSVPPHSFNVTSCSVSDIMQRLATIISEALVTRGKYTL